VKVKIIIVTLITLGFITCKKDKTNPVEDDECPPFDLPDYQPITFGYERFQYKAPHFNPNNSNEFIYHYRDNEQNEYQLYKYNLQTHQKTLVAESGKIWGQPRWSSKGWIAYAHHISYVDYIFIVKDNGDSLSQITSSTSNLSPFWSEDGSQLFWTYSPDLGSYWYLLRKNMTSLVVDTVSNMGGFHKIDVLNNKLLQISNVESGGSTFYGYHLLNSPPFTYDNFNVIKKSEHGSTGGICWHPSKLHFYVTYINGESSGLYRIDVNSLNTELLMKYCRKRYESISASSDGKYLGGERIDSYLEKDENGNITGKIMESSSIYLIDLQTLEETKIEL
jgi:hypothetical protein